MRSIRIFCRETLDSGRPVQLDRQAGRHVVQVLRMRVGDTLVLFNGDGNEYPGVIAQANRNQVTVSVGAAHAVSRESPLCIELWHALCRSEKMDSVVQKATELGVHTIRPVISDHTSTRLPTDRVGRKLEHWQRVAVSASEQCGRNRLPDICEPVTLAAALQSYDSADSAFMLHPEASESLASAPLQGPRIVVLIGPEGGFNPAETASAQARGFNLVRLGPRILRTETAPVVALGIIQLRAGDLG